MQEYNFYGDIYYLKSEVEARIIELDGWKGKDNIHISQEVDNDMSVWFVREHRKDKESGEIGKNVHKILNNDVMFIRKLIQERTEGGRKTKYRELVLDLITSKHLPISLEEFNGGRNRAKFYFPLYYYPLKILEHLKEIRYGGRGTVVRLL